MNRDHAPIPDLPAHLSPAAAKASEAPARDLWESVDTDELSRVVALAARAIHVDVGARPARPRCSPQDVLALVESMGMAARFTTLPERWWRRDLGPLVALYSDGETARPVALRRRAWGGYLAAWGDGQPLRPLSSRAARRIHRRVLSLAATLPDKNRSLVSMGRFALRPWRFDIVSLLIVMTIFGTLGLCIPMVNRRIVDQAIPDADLTLVAQWVGLLVAVNLTQTILYCVTRFHYFRILTGGTMRLQFGTWHRLIHLPAAFFRSFHSGDLVHRGLAVSTMGHQLGAMTIHSGTAAALALAAAGLLIWLQPLLAMVAMAFGVAEALVTAGVSWIVHRRTLALERQRATLLGMLVQFINGIAKLRTTGAERRAGAHWWSGFQRHTSLLDDRQRWLDRYRAMSAVLPSLTTVALYAVAFRVMSSSSTSSSSTSSLSLGGLLAFFTAYALFSQGLTSLGQLGVAVTQALSLERLVRPVWECEPESHGGRAVAGTLQGRVRFRDVCFRYRPDAPPALEHISFEIQPGEFVAIAGPSGSGKSTLVRLLLGFEQPSHGTVYYDDQDLQGLEPRSVRCQLGCVLQKSSVFAGTLFDNIAGGHRIDMAQAWEACEQAALADDIRAMPMGMYTLVAERGANLSGGQRQRLVIARALARNPRIVILDEATSALSPDAQQHIMTQLARLKVTRIVVAHRLDAIRNADRILVLDRGRLIESGPFHMLLEAGGRFAELARRSLGIE